MRIEKRLENSYTKRKYLIIVLIVFVFIGGLYGYMYAYDMIAGHHTITPVTTPIPSVSNITYLHDNQYIMNGTIYTYDSCRLQGDNAPSSAGASPGSGIPSESPGMGSVLASPTPRPVSPTPGLINDNTPIVIPFESLTDLKGSDVVKLVYTESPSVNLGDLIPMVNDRVWYMSRNYAYIGDTMALGIALYNPNNFTIIPSVVLYVYDNTNSLYKTIPIVVNDVNDTIYPGMTLEKYVSVKIPYDVNDRYYLHPGYYIFKLEILDQNGNRGVEIIKQMNILQ